MVSIELNSIVRKNLLIGLVAGVWIYLFLVLIGPFDASSVQLKNRLVMMSGYSIIFILIYWSIIPIQHYLLSKKLVQQGLRLELLFMVYIILALLPPVYIYYKSDFILGEATFTSFLLIMYLPLLVLIISILILVRFLVFKKVQKEKRVLIQGSGKYNFIQLNLSDLIFVKSSDNYIEVHYSEKNQLKMKLIRTTLKKFKEDHPECIQTHRSYVVNPTHFISWDTRNDITLTHCKVPVSETYRDDALKLISN